jgi:hypothetical protein
MHTELHIVRVFAWIIKRFKFPHYTAIRAEQRPNLKVPVLIFSFNKPLNIG